MYELTVQAMDYLLGLQWRIIHIGPYDKEQLIQNVRLHNTLDNVMHYAMLELSGGKTEVSLTVSGKTPDRPGWFLLCPVEEYDNAISSVFRVFYSFILWRERFTNLLYIDHDLHGALNCASEFLHIEALILDRDYLDRSNTNWPAWPEHVQMTAHGRLTREAIDFLYSEDPEFDETFRIRGLAEYTGVAFDSRIVYYFNIFYKEAFYARVLFTLPKESFSEGILTLAGFMCDEIQRCFLEIIEREMLRCSDSYLVQCLTGVLLGNLTEPAEVSAMLEKDGWSIDDRFELLLFESFDTMLTDQTIDYYASCINLLFSGCAAVRVEHQLICVRNVNKPQDSSYHGRLAEFIRENLLKIGISSDFSNFLLTPRYLEQASSALLIGQKLQPTRWKHCFSDYFLEYALEKITSDYTPEQLSFTLLSPLEEHDRLHPGMELMQTLYQLLACQFNATEASQKLFVHRTTFVHRMKKIQALTHLNLENPRQVLSIYLYLTLKGYGN